MKTPCRKGQLYVTTHTHTLTHLYSLSSADQSWHHIRHLDPPLVSRCPLHNPQAPWLGRALSPHAPSLRDDSSRIISYRWVEGNGLRHGTCFHEGLHQHGPLRLLSHGCCDNFRSTTTTTHKVGDATGSTSAWNLPTRTLGVKTNKRSRGHAAWVGPPSAVANTPHTEHLLW